jgi:hypothetical protein
MKAWKAIAVGAVATLAGMAWAQDTTTTTQVQMVAAKTELSKGIDAKKLKQGDPVVVKINEDVKLSSGQALAKGSSITGHVDSVQPSENKGDSKVVLVFDKAQPKSGEPFAVKAVVMGIFPPPSALGNAATPGVEPTKPVQSAPGVTDQQNAAPGVDLHSDMSESSSATLTAKGKNVKVMDGSQWQFAVAVLPNGANVSDVK